jgi:cell division protein FtsA
MFDWLRKKPSEKGIAALDIGTENIRVVVFAVEGRPGPAGEIAGRRAMIRGVGRIPIRPGDIQVGAIADIASVVRSTKQAIREASHQAGLEPDRLVMGIAGEFIKGYTSTLTFEREDPQAKISLADLRNMVHKLEWRAFAESRKRIADETGYPEIDIKLIQSEIVDVRIDRYRISNPLGFQGKQVEMSIFNAFAPLGHYGAIQTIAEELQLEMLGTVSEPFALARCVGSDETQSAICVDVGGATTDVSLVQNGSVLGAKQFGIGGRTFTKRLSLELNLSYEEAEKLKRAYVSDRLEQKSKKIISDIVAEDMEIWLDGLVLALNDFNQLTLPHKIELCGGGVHLPEFHSALNTSKWYKKLPFARTPQAIYLTQKDIPWIVDEGRRLRDKEDIVPMGLVNEGMVLAGEETMVQKVLRKVISIMQV